MEEDLMEEDVREKGIIEKFIEREITRSMLLRAQDFNLADMMAAFGAPKPAVYDDVEDTLNVAYVNREEAALVMDIFKPKVPEGTELPVIVNIHGGGLFMGGRGINRPYGRLLAHKGYLVFSLEYRLFPQATVGQQLDDVCAGMDLVGRMLVDYDVDFNRIFLVADSAGAYLAAFAAAMHESAKLQNAIGYKPSKMAYAAVAFLCGMFYPDKTLLDLVLGEKRENKNFVKYMNPEHPEIINNLPPAFLVTSRGDVLNNYSLKFKKVLKKHGRPSKLLYFGDEELLHVFMIVNPEHPKSIEATDKMLAWFESQAALRREKRKKDPQTERNRKKVEKRIADGSISRQKVWANLKERIAFDDALLKRTAIIWSDSGISRSALTNPGATQPPLSRIPPVPRRAHESPCRLRTRSLTIRWTCSPAACTLSCGRTAESPCALRSFSISAPSWRCRGRCARALHAETPWCSPTSALCIPNSSALWIITT